MDGMPNYPCSTFHSMASGFQVTGNFEASDLKLNTKRSNAPHIHDTTPPHPTPPPAPESHSVSLYGQLFSSYTPFCDQCTNWP